MWADQAVTSLVSDKTYSRAEIYGIFQERNHTLNESTFRWSLYNLQRQGRLFRIGYDKYTVSGKNVKPVYKPLYSEECTEIQAFLEDKYPDLSFVMFESILLNEFLNHQIAQNTIYVQIEKDVSSYIFDILKQEIRDVLYKPGKKEFSRYWTKGCIVVLDLVGQAPLSAALPHEIVAEKMLVDIVSEKSIYATFSPSELPGIFKNMINGYIVDSKKMNRYAGRRGKGELIKRYMGDV